MVDSVDSLSSQSTGPFPCLYWGHSTVSYTILADEKEKIEGQEVTFSDDDDKSK